MNGMCSRLMTWFVLTLLPCTSATKTQFKYLQKEHSSSSKRVLPSVLALKASCKVKTNIYLVEVGCIGLAALREITV